MQLDGIQIDDDLEWTDEFEWSPREASAERSITGAMIIEPGPALDTGRPVTLQGSQERAWHDRATVESLMTKTESTAPMALTLWDGRQLQVGWRWEDGPLEATELWPGAGYFVLTLRLRTV